MILELAKKRLQEITVKHNIDDQEITIICKTLTPEEAIGNPLHDDYPIQLGKERLIEANFMDKKGQAFSDSYFNYKGSVRDILSLNLNTNAKRAIFVQNLPPGINNVLLVGLQPRLLETLAAQKK